MLYFLLILVTIGCVLLTLIILVQNPKGGGITGGAFGAQATQFLGARQTADFLEKATWYFGIGILAVVFLCYFLTVSPNGENTQKAKVSNVSSDFTPERSMPGQKGAAPGAQRQAPNQPQQAAQPQQAPPVK